MSKNLFFDELTFLDKSFKNSDEFFDFIFPVLKQKGYVRDSFLDAIKARENDYPTALPTEPDAVALPHTDIEHIIKPFIAFTRVKGSVPWCEMANNDHILDVSFIFLLGFMDKDGHINLLQALMGNLSDEQFMQHLKVAQTSEEIVQFLTSSVQF
ncbi:PTS sugar transporter subunit IIA [Zophobihabitans entericus]|uniref:PTS sugar transporter subunit IIA n=1 Tax=Zophobihabitans entericus TaxID=1635327 RepID=A0A6G9I9F7_9GAMM|nr:PTS sugar transporter subunit IIA [Zophobihabitans entericus]QIQ20462.1 PTS sugar transporter subunit IIA [Zophobihabitans entericus]